jgi:Zn-dependent peptidase ImmA (M78 family)
MEKEMQDLINKYSAKTPTPVVALAKALNADVFESTQLPDSVSGFIARKSDGAGYEIVVNAKHSTQRKRFTIAHEIAHLILHKAKIDSGEMPQDFIKRPFVLARKKGAKIEAEEKIEKEADNLAADILMPENVFRNVWQNSTDVEQVAEYFNVSQAAATVRASVLTCQSSF